MTCVKQGSKSEASSSINKWWQKFCFQLQVWERIPILWDNLDSETNFTTYWPVALGFHPKYPVFPCNKTRYCVYIHRVNITGFMVYGYWFMKKASMPFKKKQLFVQSESVNLSIKNRVLFFSDNYNLKVETLSNPTHCICLILKWEEAQDIAGVIQLISYKRYSFKEDYLSIPWCTGSCGYLFHEIPGR